MSASAEVSETALTRDADLLEQTGCTREEAERMVLQDAVVHATASVGAVYPSLRGTELGQIWNKAERAGARNVVLNVRAEGDTPEEYAGRVTVIVLENDPWPEHDTNVPGLREATRTSSAGPENRRLALGSVWLKFQSQRMMQATCTAAKNWCPRFS